jgi:hypothetical protein
MLRPFIIQYIILKINQNKHLKFSGTVFKAYNYVWKLLFSENGRKQVIHYSKICSCRNRHEIDLQICPDYIDSFITNNLILLDYRGPDHMTPKEINKHNTEKIINYIIA